MKFLLVAILASAAAAPGGVHDQATDDAVSAAESEAPVSVLNKGRPHSKATKRTVRQTDEAERGTPVSVHNGERPVPQEAEATARREVELLESEAPDSVLNRDRHETPTETRQAKAETTNASR